MGRSERLKRRNNLRNDSIPTPTRTARKRQCRTQTEAVAPEAVAPEAVAPEAVADACTGTDPTPATEDACTGTDPRPTAEDACTGTDPRPTAEDACVGTDPRPTTEDACVGTDPYNSSESRFRYDLDVAKQALRDRSEEAVDFHAKAIKADREIVRLQSLVHSLEEQASEAKSQFDDYKKAALMIPGVKNAMESFYRPFETYPESSKIPLCAYVHAQSTGYFPNYIPSSPALSFAGGYWGRLRQQ